MWGVDIKSELYTKNSNHFDVGTAVEKMGRILTAPCTRNRTLMGFTQYPFSSIMKGGFNWKLLRRYRPAVVAWTRNNLVHRALSKMRLCSNFTRGHNTRHEDEAAACAASQHTIDKTKFLMKLTKCACDNSGIAEVAKAAAGPDPVHAMLYEDFVVNATHELIELFRYLGLGTQIKVPTSSFIKRSATNVTTMLLNADKVIGWLQTWERADLPLVKMLRDTAYHGFAYDASTSCAHLTKLSRDVS